METEIIVIVLGTLFTLLLLALTIIIVVAAQRKKSKLELEVQLLEVKRQKDIAENTLISQEKERQRVGLELHDELGPTFAAIRFNIDRIKQKLDKNELESIAKIADETSSNLESAIGDFSDISKLLYPVILVRHGLQKAIDDLVQKADFDPSRSVNLVFSIDPPKKEIVQLSIYRVCQELLTNASKHSKSNNVSLSVKEDNQQIQINYSDNGVGFDAETVNRGLGLNSIKGRIEAIGGSVEMHSLLSKGVTYKISIPND